MLVPRYANAPAGVLEAKLLLLLLPELGTLNRRWRRLLLPLLLLLSVLVNLQMMLPQVLSNNKGPLQCTYTPAPLHERVHVKIRLQQLCHTRRENGGGLLLFLLRR